MPDANESPGQDMKQKAANELVGVKSHQLLLVSLPVIFPAECDLAILEADQTFVGYGDAVGIAAEIVQHLSRAAKGRLRVDYPFDLAAGFEGGSEVFRIGERLKGPMQSKLSSGVGILEMAKEQAAEKTRKNAHGKEEALGPPATMA